MSTTFNGFHYFATTSTLDQKLTPYLAMGTNQPIRQQPGGDLGHPDRAAEQHQPAASGFVVSGCSDFTSGDCPLVPVTTTTNTSTNPPTQQLNPAMYLSLADGLQIGLLTNLQATTAILSLPLRHAAGTDPNLLESAPLIVSSIRRPPSPAPCRFDSNDAVDTYLVTHGTLVTALNNIPF